MIEPVPTWPPVAGFYAVKLVRGGPRVPCRVWFGLAIINGEEQDRAPDWHCEIDGHTDRWEVDGEYRCRIPLEIDRAWPFCAKEPISESVYRFMVKDAEWARAHAPDDPKASPRKAVDFNTAPLPF